MADGRILHLICLLALATIQSVYGIGEVIFAVNCGGSAHTDLNGVHYQADYNTVGISSDFGLQLSINRVPTPDQVLYQTERYHSETFSYDIPIKEDDDYVLILKFSEVYFTGSNMKVSSYPVVQ